MHLGVLTLGFSLSSAHAAPAKEAISLQRLLETVQGYHPKLASANAKGQAAKAYLTSAKGSFDPKLSAGADIRPVGQSRFGSVSAKVSQRTPFWGLSGFAGYQLGWGDFPIYMGDRKTGTLGKLKAGVSLPVLSGGKIDQARADIQQRGLQVSAQQCEIEKVRLDLLQEAANVYWDWVARALEVQIKQELLSVAQARGLALQTRLDNGAVAAIVLLDNQRLIIARESKLIEAERKLNQSGVKMSLFWRDANGDPSLVQASQVPETLGPRGGTHLRDHGLGHHSPQAIDEALARMPELCRLRASIADAQVQVALTRNQRLPSLDLSGYVARYLGDKIPVLPTDVGVGVQFSVALGLRKVTGKWRAAQASLESLMQKRRGMRDKVAASLAKARIERMAAHRQLQIADRKVLLSQDMAKAERAKFEQGASDLILVNLREQALADAQRDRVSAWANLQKSKVQELRAQGLDPLSSSS